METKIDTIKTKRIMWSLNNFVKSILIGSMMLLIGMQAPILAQQSDQESEYTMPSWRFGVVGGANFNFYEGTTQRINDDLMALQPFRHGDGIGLYAAPVIEYHRDGSLFGFMLQAGFDSRRGEFDQVMSPCDCPLDLSTELSYITIEPSLRIAPFRSNFFLFTGPRLAFLYDKSFEYNKGINPDFPNSTTAENVEGDFSEMEDTQFSFQVGAGWDIPLNNSTNKTRFMLSPFVSYHPYFGQEPRSIETWNITTIRAGLAFKIGQGKEIYTAPAQTVPAEPAPAPEIEFMVDSPRNTEVRRIYVETFPLPTLVFFNEGSTSIPGRYHTIDANEAETFKEEQIGPFKSINPNERSTRQMTVYYNILNILGDRMGKNPSSTITLVGSSEVSEQDAVQMAESVKSYLVDTFGIGDSRINIEGQMAVEELQPSKMDVELRREEMRRVSIESSSPELLAEYETKPENFESLTQGEAPEDSYLTFSVDGETESLASWSLEVKDDETGEVHTFGPYERNSVSIPGEELLGERPEGSFTITMTGEATNGTTVKRRSNAEVVLWQSALVEVASRYSVLFDFDSSVLHDEYKTHINDAVLPEISSGTKVQIHGHADIIGAPEYNLNLSEDRANTVRDYLQQHLQNEGITNVEIEIVAHGEESTPATFENTYPEQRFYNRTAVIDIVVLN